MSICWAKGILWSLAFCYIFWNSVDFFIYFFFLPLFDAIFLCLDSPITITVIIPTLTCSQSAGVQCRTVCSERRLRLCSDIVQQKFNTMKWSKICFWCTKNRCCYLKTKINTFWLHFSNIFKRLYSSLCKYVEVFMWHKCHHTLMIWWHRLNTSTCLWLQKCLYLNMLPLKGTTLVKVNQITAD